MGGKCRGKERVDKFHRYSIFFTLNPSTNSIKPRLKLRPYIEPLNRTFRLELRLYIAPKPYI